MECMDHSNSADGSKSLTNPSSVNFTAKPGSFVPKERGKCRKALLSAPSSVSACDISSISELDSDTSNLSNKNESGSDKAIKNEFKAANTFFDVGFVSAREYMNPAGPNLVQKVDYTKTISVSATNQSSQSSVPARRTRKNSRLPTQKNLLDNYFKLSSNLRPSQTGELLISTKSSFSLESCSQPTNRTFQYHTIQSLYVGTAEHSPFMTSSSSKLANSNGIYHCQSSSQGCNSRSQPKVTVNMYKKIKRMDVMECMDHSNSADGSKPLTNPSSVNFTAKPGSLVPKERGKCRKALLSAPSSVSACDISSISELDSDTSNLSNKNESGSDEPIRNESKAANTFFDVGFVSAREYMNPAGPNLVQKVDYTKTISVSATNQSSQSSVPARQTKKNSRLPTQKNSLDNYFKLSSSLRPSQTGELLISANNSFSLESCSQPTSSSSKLADSNGIYYSQSSSQGCNPHSQPEVFWGVKESSSGLDKNSHASENSEDAFELRWPNVEAKPAIGSKLCDTRKKKIGEGTSKSVPKRHKTRTNTRSLSKETLTCVTPRNCSSVPKKSGTSTPSSKELSNSMSSDLFGMFGFSNSTLIAIDSDSDFDEDANPDYISELPVEVLRNVFCRLPFMDLCLNINRVCLAWRIIISSSEVTNNPWNTIKAKLSRIILRPHTGIHWLVPSAFIHHLICGNAIILTNDQFMPWKKTYHRLLKSDNQTIEDMKKRMIEAEMTTQDVYLAMLIRYMKPFKPGTGRLMGNPLHKHHLYQCAVEVMKERYPGCMTANEVPNPWCMVVILVILSNSVADVGEILKCMLGCRAKCTAEELIDCLYCVASFLLTFKIFKPNDVWARLHYQLYYALYLYENDSESTFGGLSNALTRGGGQQSICRYSSQNTKVRLTHEQLRICNHNLQDGELVKIVAFAGTGKTTTLLEYARLRPDMKFLLIVYNRSVKEHAQERFPVNVECVTSHGLAFKYVGRKYSAVGKLGFNVKVSDVLQHMTPRQGLSHYVQAKFIVDTLNHFMVSADEIITSAHVPETMMHETKGPITIDHPTRMNLSNDAEKIWNKMINLQDFSLRLPHDGYLKLWQLQRPRLRDYDIIMIDEAQDLTPAVADIFRRQTQARIMVGDPHQQIYSFRGAVNAMDMISATRTFYLTQSFRFGPEIASIAATCLEFLKGEKRKILVGSGQPGGVTGEQDGQLAIITRTNFQLFKEAVAKCVYSDKKLTVAFAGGVDSFGLDMIQDIYMLMNDTSFEQKRSFIKNQLIKGFIGSGYGAFKKYVVKTVDVELSGKIRIAEAYGSQLASHIQLIKSRTISDIRLADIVLSTAHKAKGLEFDTVQLSDDYKPDETSPTNGLNRTAVALDECNLLYVAITRAKKRLLMSPTLVTILKRAGYDFCQLKSTKQLQKDGISLVCDLTKAAFEATNAVTLFHPNIATSNGCVTGVIVYSPESVVEKFSSLRHIAGVIDPDLKVKSTI